VRRLILRGDINITNRMKQLIHKMENAPDFGYDDEEVELDMLLTKKGLGYTWESTFLKPQIIVFKLTDDEVRNIYAYKHITSSYKCKRCGRDMSPVDYYINHVCLACSKERR
jgi:hypothetical protein